MRDAIAAWECERGFSVTPDGVVVTVGATEALFASLAALLNPGDEVIIPSPAYIVYGSITTLLHATPVVLDTVQTDFQISLDALMTAITKRTKAIVLTSPNNPTGCILSHESLDVVARVAAEKNFYVICDDVYRELSYVQDVPRFAAKYPQLSDRIIVTNSFSKPWAMTGWRLGWVATTDSLAADIAKVHQQMVSSVPSFLQASACEALGTSTSDSREKYRRRRDITLDALAKMALPTVRPEGAFYAFPRISEFGLSSEEFCLRAIEEAEVALVPGVFFGAEGFVRISYAVSEETLREGLARLHGFVDRLRTL